jgi:hypothetical protein
MQYDIASFPSQGSLQVAQHLVDDLSRLLAPLLTQLNAQIDRRLVQTFLHTIAVIITFVIVRKPSCEASWEPISPLRSML